MPIVVQSKGNSDSTNDLIRKFKKATSAADIVRRVKDRRYNVKPSQQRNVKNTERRRLLKRIHNLKQMKNISPKVIERLMERLND